MGDRIDRRTYLQGLLALSAASAGCQELGLGDDETPTQSPTSSPPGTPSPSPTATEGTPTPAAEVGPFDEVVDVVEAAGCDPDGGSVCTEHLTEAVEPGRLLTFPPGTYQLGSPLEIDVDGRVGLFAGRDVRLLPPKGFEGMLLQVDAPEFLLQGLDIDLTAENTTAGVEITCDDGFVVEDVEYHGRGVHESPTPPFACNLSVRSPSGMGFVRNLQALEGSAIGHYKNAAGRGGIWIGQRNQGTIRIENCRLEEFGNNGIYASRTPGNVEIVGGVYRNNNAANIRFGGEGSFAEGVTVEMDFSKYSGPTTGLESQFTTRGIVIEQGPEPGIKPPGAEIRDCEIRMRRSPFGGTAISAWSTARTVTVKRTRIRTDIDGFPAVFRAPMKQVGEGQASKPPRFLHLEDVHISGSADDNAAVNVIDAPNSRIRNTSILQSGSGRDGIALARSGGSVVDASSVRVPGYPLVVVYDEDTAPDDCLVELRNDPQFNRRVGQENLGSTTDLELATAACLSTDQLPDLPGAGRVEVVSTGADGIYYRVVEPE